MATTHFLSLEVWNHESRFASGSNRVRIAAPQDRTICIALRGFFESHPGTWPKVCADTLETTQNETFVRVDQDIYDSVWWGSRLILHAPLGLWHSDIFSLLKNPWLPARSMWGCDSSFHTFKAPLFASPLLTVFVNALLASTTTTTTTIPTPTTTTTTTATTTTTTRRGGDLWATYVDLWATTCSILQR